MVTKPAAQLERIEATIGFGDDNTFEDGILRYFSLLSDSLSLPCVVTGIEDLRWEEYFILGPGSLAEYRTRKSTQPSFHDKFELLSIKTEYFSE